MSALACVVLSQQVAADSLVEHFCADALPAVTAVQCWANYVHVPVWKLYLLFAPHRLLILAFPHTSFHLNFCSTWLFLRLGGQGSLWTFKFKGMVALRAKLRPLHRGRSKTFSSPELCICSKP